MNYFEGVKVPFHILQEVHNILTFVMQSVNLYPIWVNG